MTPPLLMTMEQRIAAMQERLEAAKQELYGLCDGSRTFTMSVPARPTDTDEVIAAAFDDADWLLSCIPALCTVAEAAERMPEDMQVTWFDEDRLLCRACDTWTVLKWENARVVVREAEHAPDCPWLQLQLALQRWKEVQG